MHCALGRSFYGASKMAVTLGRKAPQSNQARIKVGLRSDSISDITNLLKRVLNKLAGYFKEGDTACKER